MNGTLLEISKNGIEVEKGSVVTFTATPTDDYTFSGWVGSISGRETPKTVTIKENMFITVDFALKRFAVNYECVPVEGGVITATADGQPLAESGTEVEKYKNVTFKATAHDGYYLDHWDGWEGASAAGENDTVQVKVLNKVSVKAVFKRLYPVVFASNDENKGTVTAKVNGESIESGTKVREAQNVTFTATPKPDYYVKAWTGATPQTTVPQTEPMEATIVVSEPITVNVDFAKIMRLTIRPKIYNESLKSWSTEGWDDHKNPNYKGGVHISHKCAVQVSGGSNVTKSWDYMFPIKNKDGKWVIVQSEEFIKVRTEKSADADWLNTKFSSFEGLKINLSNYLLKANRHDYWYAEWTTGGGIFTPPTMYPLQAIDDNSVFPLIYNETTGMWTVDKDNVNIKRSDDIPLPAEFAGTKPNPNRKISYKGVTITYDENFTLADGEEKDFVIKYEVDNHDETRSKGTVKVIYTIGWK